jgi:hypothetical protein
VGLIQNILEGAGLVTISMTLKAEVTEQVHVPRAATIRFPYGFSVGPAFDPQTQISIVKDALRLIYEIDQPETIVKLPYRWRGKL